MYLLSLRSLFFSNFEWPLKTGFTVPYSLHSHWGVLISPVDCHWGLLLAIGPAIGAYLDDRYGDHPVGSMALSLVDCQVGF